MGFFDTLLAAARGAYYDYRGLPDKSLEEPGPKKTYLGPAPTPAQLRRNLTVARHQDFAKKGLLASLEGNIGEAGADAAAMGGSTNPLLSLLLLGEPVMMGLMGRPESPRPLYQPAIPEAANVNGVGVPNELMARLLARMRSGEDPGLPTNRQLPDPTRDRPAGSLTPLMSLGIPRALEPSIRGRLPIPGKTYYHGTNEPFTGPPDPRQARNGLIWAAPNPARAAQFAGPDGRIYTGQFRPGNPLVLTDGKYETIVAWGKTHPPNRRDEDDEDGLAVRYANAHGHDAIIEPSGPWGGGEVILQRPGAISWNEARVVPQKRDIAKTRTVAQTKLLPARGSDMVPQWVVDEKIGGMVPSKGKLTGIEDLTGPLGNRPLGPIDDLVGPLGNVVALPGGGSAPVREPNRTVTGGTGWYESGPVVTNLLNTWFPDAPKDLLHKDEVGQTFRHLGGGKWVFKKTEEEPPIKKSSNELGEVDRTEYAHEFDNPYLPHIALDAEQRAATPLLDQLRIPNEVRIKTGVKGPNRTPVSYSKEPSGLSKFFVRTGELRPDDAQLFDHYNYVLHEAMKQGLFGDKLSKTPSMGLRPLNTTKHEAFGLVTLNNAQTEVTGPMGLAFRYEPEVARLINEALANAPEYWTRSMGLTPTKANDQVGLEHLTETIAHEIAHTASINHNVPFVKYLNEIYPKVYDIVHSYPHLKEAGSKSLHEVFGTQTPDLGPEVIAKVGPIRKSEIPDPYAEILSHLATGTMLQKNVAFRKLQGDKELASKIRGALWKHGVKDETDLQDMATEVYTDAFMNAGKFTGDNGQAYILGLASNKALKYARERKKLNAGAVPLDAPVEEGQSPPQIEDVGAAKVDEGIDVEKIQQTLVNVLGKMRPQDKEVVLESIFGQKSRLALAKQWDISMRAVDGRLHVAKKAFKALLKESGLTMDDLKGQFKDLPQGDKPEPFYPAGGKFFPEAGKREKGRPGFIPPYMIHGDPYKTGKKKPK